MSRIPNAAPPTARQIEMFQAVVMARSISAAARVMDVHVETVRHAVHGFLVRAKWLR